MACAAPASRKALLLAALLCVPPAFADSVGPGEWLQRMSAAVQSASYEGTVIRMQGGKAEALKVARDIADGVVREKVVAQEGNGLEIIRNGNKVHCILPDRKSVLVEEWDDQARLFSSLPSSDIRFGSEYDVSIVREDRVAGRDAMLLAIRAHDRYRYGHRIWLDVETAFPLQTQLIRDDGETIEQVKFAEITLNEEVRASALAPSHDTEGFRWFSMPARHIDRAVDTSWNCDNLPQGFRVISSHKEEVTGSDELVTHIMYSDGLASVSVFIAAAGDDDAKGPSQVAGSHSFSMVVGEHHVTAVGQVPAETVAQIASSMRRR
ncbi:MAG: MucB/RseB C-terminal domain-containing protein [Gammaproteobacteria bacterium]|nr:MucB/RseB C-terminal domain-containing protein [Gammaproteobacteria bacterium]